MKKTIKGAIALFGLALCLSTADAQDYEISFAGTGASTTVESVEVQNLTQGTALTLAQGEILNLKGPATSVRNFENNSKGLIIYPNPVTESGNIEFVAQATGLCFVEVYNLMGKKIVSNKYELSEGNHQFKISGLSSGIYTIKVQYDTYS